MPRSGVSGRTPACSTGADGRHGVGRVGPRAIPTSYERSLLTTAIQMPGPARAHLLVALGHAAVAAAWHKVCSLTAAELGELDDGGLREEWVGHHMVNRGLILGGNADK